MSNTVLSKQNFFQRRFFSFVDKRNRCDSSYILTHRNLYILPSKLGIYFLLTIVIIWLIGTNYQNNLVLGLVFLLLSIFLLGILHTFSNMVRLTVSYSKYSPAFAGEEVNFLFNVTNAKKRFCESIEFRWQNSDADSLVVSVPPGQSKVIAVPIPSVRRGRIKPGRLLVRTYYPLGLFRCWTWISWNIDAVVFPAPVEIPMIKSVVVDEEGDGAHPTIGGDDYSGLKTYRDGDSIKHIAWKAFAQEKGLYSKEFSQNLSQELWLDFESTSANGVEEKLSGLTYWAIHYHQLDENYGLRLPGMTIEPNKGEVHKIEVLTALALFGLG